MMDKLKLIDDYHSAIQIVSLHVWREHPKIEELLIIKHRLFESLERVQADKLKQYDLAYTLFKSYNLEYK